MGIRQQPSRFPPSNLASVKFSLRHHCPQNKTVKSSKSQRPRTHQSVFSIQKSVPRRPAILHIHSTPMPLNTTPSMNFPKSAIDGPLSSLLWKCLMEQRSAGPSQRPHKPRNPIIAGSTKKLFLQLHAPAVSPLAFPVVVCHRTNSTLLNKTGVIEPV